MTDAEYFNELSLAYEQATKDEELAEKFMAVSAETDKIMIEVGGNL